MSMPDMITKALQAESLFGDTSEGLEPREILSSIRQLIWPQAKSEAVSSIVWRMWKRGQLEKIGTRYRLPQKNEPSDGKSWPDTSEGSDHQPPAQGREAGPGGGT